MVVYYPAGLQVGIDCDRADKLNSAFFQILANPAGESVADGNGTLVLPLVENCLAAGEGPDIVTEGTTLFTVAILVASRCIMNESRLCASCRKEIRYRILCALIDFQPCY